MPHILPDCVEQSATKFLIEHRRKPNSIAVRLTRDVLLLRGAGSSRRAIAAALPDIAPKDKAVALKFYRVRYDGLSPAEKDRFKRLFKRYSADNVRQALGSAPKDIGSFGIAA